MPPSTFSDTEKEMYQHNVQFYLDSLLNPTIEYKPKNGVEIVADYDLKLQKLTVDFLNQEQNQILRQALQEFLYQIVIELDFNNPDDLNITLKDYLDYVRRKRS